MAVKDSFAEVDGGPSTGGSQTLLRGLDIIEAVAAGHKALTDLADYLHLTKSTAHRLARALVERGYLATTPRRGYRLGAKLLALGFLAQHKTDLVQIARPHIEALASRTGDTVHLGVIDADMALYLDKIQGQRRVQISSQIGERQPLTSTGLGKALILDHPESYWRERFKADRRAGASAASFAKWRARMKQYVAAGRAFDLEENEDQIRCVAAPIRNAEGRVVAAISVASAAQYMSDSRMEKLSPDARRTAALISRELGWESQPGK
jgi:DNA-binding IclR family transcriptional regulator